MKDESHPALVVVSLANERFTIVLHEEFYDDHDSDAEWQYMPGTEDSVEDYVPVSVTELMRIDEGMMAPDQAWWPETVRDDVMKALQAEGHRVSTASWHYG